MPFFNPEISLIGYSLGGIFLTKYLSENSIFNKIISLHLVGAPYDSEGTDYSMGDFVLTNDLLKATEQVQSIYFYQSKDDPIVPIIQLAKYQKLFPNAETRIFEDRGHFYQSEFPELVKDIRKVYK